MPEIRSPRKANSKGMGIMGADINTTINATILAGHAAEIRRLGKRVVADVIEIGKLLGEAKRIAGYGNFLPWLDREFRWTEMTATRFINVYEMSKSNNLLDLELPLSGLYLLAAPSTPAEARDQIIERAQTGESIPIAEVKHTIEKAKGRQQPSSKTRNPTTKAAKPKPSEADAALKPSHDRSARKLFDHFGEAPGEVQRHFLQVMRDDVGPASIGEIERITARNAQLESENAALRNRVAELEAQLLDVPGFLDRTGGPA